MVKCNNKTGSSQNKFKTNTLAQAIKKKPMMKDIFNVQIKNTHVPPALDRLLIEDLMPAL